LKKDINPVEKSEQRKRSRISFIFSVSVHIVLLIIIIISSKIPVNENPIVMTVKLTDRINEEMKNLPESEKKKIIKKQKKALKEKEKELEKIKKQIEKDILSDKEKKVSDEPVEIDDKNDVFKEYEKKKIEEEEQLEESFFEKENVVEKEKVLESIDEELDTLDDFLDELDMSEEEDQIGAKGQVNMNDDNIQWENSTGRILVYRTEIKISEEFMQKGLKTSLKIRFTVFESGLVANVEVVASSGFPKLDQEVIEQFKRWKFKEAPGVPPIYGITEINIGY